MGKAIKIMREEDFNTRNWSGGKTKELYIYPEDSNYEDRDFQFRISSATVESEESNFTKLQGINRFITPLDGKLKLTHDGDKFIELKPFQIYEFSGEIDTNSFGKVTDFNLMMRMDAEGKLEGIEIKDKLILPIGNLDSFNIQIFYSFNGNFKFEIYDESFDLNPGELLVLDLKELNADEDIKISSKSKNTILRVKVKI